MKMDPPVKPTTHAVTVQPLSAPEALLSRPCRPYLACVAICLALLSVTLHLRTLTSQQQHRAELISIADCLLPLGGGAAQKGGTFTAFKYPGCVFKGEEMPCPGFSREPGHAACTPPPVLTATRSPSAL